MTGIPTMPDKPTDAIPGTEAKLIVLAERAAKGQSLWHPDDFGGGKFDLEGLPW